MSNVTDSTSPLSNDNGLYSLGVATDLATFASLPTQVSCMPSPYNYAAEKFDSARRSLMLPHPGGEARSVADAFAECMRGLHDIKPGDLDESAADWVRTLNGLMDAQGILDAAGVGTFQLKAEKLTKQQKSNLSRVVDELAHWFASRARGER